MCVSYCVCDQHWSWSSYIGDRLVVIGLISSNNPVARYNRVHVNLKKKKRTETEHSYDWRNYRLILLNDQVIRFHIQHLNWRKSLKVFLYLQMMSGVKKIGSHEIKWAPKTFIYSKESGFSSRCELMAVKVSLFQAGSWKQKKNEANQKMGMIHLNRQLLFKILFLLRQSRASMPSSNPNTLGYYHNKHTAQSYHAYI